MRSPAVSTFFTTRRRSTGGRGVRYARTTANAHHVSEACMQLPCARLVRIMPPTLLPQALRAYAAAFDENLVKDICYRDRCAPSVVVVCPSGKWLVGPSSTSSTIASIFI
jgi:hypothetical protein